MTAEERFWTKVRKTSGCWLWTAGKRGGGYGSFYLDGRNRAAHRVSYEWANGPIPADLVVDHVCRTPACVRPDHLRAVTQRDNLLNGPTIIAAELARDECRQGHALMGDNLLITKQGWRECLTCTKERWRRAEARKAARRAASRESLRCGAPSRSGAACGRLIGHPSGHCFDHRDEVTR